ncbi:hypothetical protein NFI96_023859, partial [Prochilodus magdalenae]
MPTSTYVPLCHNRLYVCFPRSVSLDVNPGRLVAVVGAVGSGKSSLISALLGEMHNLSGSINIKLEHPHTVPADGAVGVEVEGHQAFWTCDYTPLILVLTTVPPHTGSLGVSTKTKAGLSCVVQPSTTGCLMEDRASLVHAFCPPSSPRLALGMPTGSVAYVPQQAWIQNATLKDNILFGSDPEEKKFRRVVQACALEPDLELLPGGVLTEIGEKGINLSGGQKQRVSLARAAYSSADVYLLDDPLSAVDSHVGKHLFERVIGPRGLLKDKTRILVTHGISFLPYVDEIVVLVDGVVSEVGSYSSLRASKGAFSEFLDTYAKEESGGSDARKESASDIEETDIMPEGQDPQADSPPEDVVSVTLKRENSLRHSQRHAQRNGSLKVRRSSSARSKKDSQEMKKGQRLIEKEAMETGKVKFSVYLQYLRALGWGYATMFVLVYFLQNVAYIGGNVWLSDWTKDATDYPNGSSYPAHIRDMRIGVFGALGIAQDHTTSPEPSSKNLPPPPPPPRPPPPPDHHHLLLQTTTSSSRTTTSSSRITTTSSRPPSTQEPPPPPPSDHLLLKNHHHLLLQTTFYSRTTTTTSSRPPSTQELPPPPPQTTFYSRTTTSSSRTTTTSSSRPPPPPPDHLLLKNHHLLLLQNHHHLLQTTFYSRTTTSSFSRTTTSSFRPPPPPPDILFSRTTTTTSSRPPSTQELPPPPPDVLLLKSSRKGILVFLGTLFLAEGAIRASRRLHSRLLSNILKVPMLFFDTTPSGRVVNRFAK